MIIYYRSLTNYRSPFPIIAHCAQVHAAREESYEKLQKHRASLRTDRHYLVEHQKQHERLIKIGDRTDQLASSVDEVM